MHNCITCINTFENLSKADTRTRSKALESPNSVYINSNMVEKVYVTYNQVNIQQHLSNVAQLAST